MILPKVYVDFQNVDDANRLRLTCAGTLQDLARHGIQVHEGLVLTFYSDDANNQGQPDELRVEGMVHYDTERQCWVAAIDWAAVRHASEEGVAGARPRVVALLPREGGLSGGGFFALRCCFVPSPSGRGQG